MTAILDLGRFPFTLLGNAYSPAGDALSIAIVAKLAIPVLQVKWEAPLYSSFMSFDQWRFFSVPELLHGTSVPMVSSEGAMTFTTAAERLTVELSLDFMI